MATLVCRVQLLDDTDPFNSTNFPEPTRPPLYTFREDIPLATQLPGVHRLLRAPQKVLGEGEVGCRGHRANGSGLPAGARQRRRGAERRRAAPGPCGAASRAPHPAGLRAESAWPTGCPAAPGAAGSRAPPALFLAPAI